MDHIFDSLARRSQACLVQQAHAAEINFTPELRDVLPLARGKIIQAANALALLHQLMRDRRPNKTRYARDQILRHSTLLTACVMKGTVTGCPSQLLVCQITKLPILVDAGSKPELPAG